MRTPLLLLVLLFPAFAAAQDVVWTDVVNVAGDGAMIQKTAGCDGCDDAGMTSEQQLSAGDGYVEFTVGELNTLWLAGLSHGNEGTGYADIDFAFFFNGGGYAEIRENGAYRADTVYAPGDTFRVAVVGGRVQYFRNGTMLRESAAAPQYPLLLDASLLTMGATIRDAVLDVAEPPPAGGGLLEKAGSPALRARFTPAEIAALLPPGGERGAFTFPAPYNTTAVRLTNAADCAGGQDCLWYLGYSYWRNINNHAGSADLYIFLGMDRARGGAGPSLLRFNKVTRTVERLGPLFDANDIHSYATGEGWYFSGTHPTRLYTFLVGSDELRRYDVVSRAFEADPVMSVPGCRDAAACPADATFLAQPHSSDDDLVHVATIKNSDWQRRGCMVYESAFSRYRYYGTPADALLDECHIDRSGRWLVSVETLTSTWRLRNRIVDLATDTVATLDAGQGALGHLDMGYGYAVGADTQNALANATVVIEFGQGGSSPAPVVHFNKRWDLIAANHVAHGNAQPGSPQTQYACGSNASRVTDMADEIVCFPLDAGRNADGSLDVLSVGQVMSDLDAAGGQDLDGDDYEQRPKGNLDLTGRYFIWTTNLGGDRLDAFLVEIPGERLTPP